MKKTITLTYVTNEDGPFVKFSVSEGARKLNWMDKEEFLSDCITIIEELYGKPTLEMLMKKSGSIYNVR